MSNSSIWPINRTLSGTTTPSQSGPGSDGNEGVHHIPQSSNITGASPSDCSMSYPGHSFKRALLLYREAVGVFYYLSLLRQLTISPKIYGYITWLIVLHLWTEFNHLVTCTGFDTTLNQLWIYEKCQLWQIYPDGRKGSTCFI